MSNQIVKVKNKHRVGKATLESPYGEVELEVYKHRQGTIYYGKIDGRNTGLSRSSAEEMWDLLGEYLSISVVQGDK